MNLKRLENHRGVALYVRPDDVDSLSESIIDGCTAITTRTGEKLIVKGNPDAVHVAIYGKAPTKGGEDFYLSGDAVVAALTTEYRMTLEDDDSAAQQVRVAIRSAAEAMGITLDDRLLNTPLEG